MNVSRRSLFLRLAARFKPYRIRFFQAVVMMALVAGLKGGGVYLIKPIVDNVLIHKQPGMFLAVLIIIPSFFLLKFAACYTLAYLMSWIGQRATQSIRDDLFSHLHELSVEFYWRRRSGEIMSRVTNDLTGVQSCLQTLPLYLVRDTLTFGVLLFVLFYLHWKFALITLLVIPMAGAVLYVLGRKMRSASARSQEVTAEIYHRFQESLQGMAIVKAFNYEESAVKKFRGKNADLFSQMMKYLRATALSGPLMELTGGLALTFLIFYGGKEIFADKLTPGEFFAFLGGFLAAYAPLKNIARSNSTLQMGLASWQRIAQLLDEKPSVRISSSPGPVPSLKGDIRFDNVSYRYPGSGQFAVRDLNIRIKPGEVVAFAGPSGSGKTTIVHLCLRLFDPASGSVSYDGHDLKDLDLKGLRSHMGLVTQETVLFDDTVFNNIALGRTGVSMEDVISASKAADAHDFISGLPQGYSTVLGERGAKLSGGQRQRLAIARAVLKKPSVLVLDEATSNLDTASEKSIQGALERVLAGHTVIMVAHRLSTIEKADRIFVLDRGQIAESGSHRELLKKPGIYSKLYRIQSTAARLAPEAVGNI